jgi:prophage regulatory protein
MSSATVDRAVAEGRFPRPVRLSRNRVAWIAGEVKAWMADRVAERDRDQAAA